MNELEYFINHAYNDERTCRVNHYQDKAIEQFARLSIDNAQLYQEMQHAEDTCSMLERVITEQKETIVLFETSLSVAKQEGYRLTQKLAKAQLRIESAKHAMFRVSKQVICDEVDTWLLEDEE